MAALAPCIDCTSSAAIHPRSLSPRQLRPGSPALPQHLVVYRIETDDLAKVYAEVNRRVTSGETRMSDSVDLKSFVNRTYRVIRPELAGNKSVTGAAAATSRQGYGHFVFGEAKAGTRPAR